MHQQLWVFLPQLSFAARKGLAGKDLDSIISPCLKNEANKEQGRQLSPFYTHTHTDMLLQTSLNQM